MFNVALKLEYSAFPVENIIAVRSVDPRRALYTTDSSIQDCMELLLPMAAQKLDLSFDIESNVPPCASAQSLTPCMTHAHRLSGVIADYDRIRQGMLVRRRRLLRLIAI